MDPDERAREGVFMAFQYPVEIAGVNNAYFLKAALNAKRKHHGQPELDADRVHAADSARRPRILDIDQSMLSRAVNEGFSGGEKKRNEIFQMALLEPKLAILDETDSGLDIDALKIVANGVNAMRSPDRADDRRHALSAAARLHRAGLRARAERRPDREVGRQGAGAGARGEGLRLDREPAPSRCRHRRHDAGGREASSVGGALEQRPAGGPRWLQDLRERGAATLRGARVPDRSRRRVALHERRADRRRRAFSRPAPPTALGRGAARRAARTPTRRTASWSSTAASRRSCRGSAGCREA